MPCFHPIQGYRTSSGTVIFHEDTRQVVSLVTIACGQCSGCRLERSRQWAVRCVHEASLYDENSFVTLTYDDAHLPLGGSLRYRDFQLFMKRLRKKFNRKVRFFMCGEYGAALGRPHYHAVLFNCAFPDRVFSFTSDSGAAVYRSESLEALWSHGLSSVGDVTFQSAAYVSRYCMGKVTGDLAEDHYRLPCPVVDLATGEICRELVPEFCHMSLKPGIGAGWLDKFQGDVFPRGLVVVNGVEVPPPRYYDRRFASRDLEDEFSRIVAQRERDARSRYLDNTDSRLRVKEQVLKARVSFLKRGNV